MFKYSMRTTKVLMSRKCFRTNENANYCGNNNKVSLFNYPIPNNKNHHNKSSNNSRKMQDMETSFVRCRGWLRMYHLMTKPIIYGVRPLKIRINILKEKMKWTKIIISYVRIINKRRVINLISINQSSKTRTYS